MMKKYEILEFKKIGNQDIGYLSALEELREIPFDIRRVYYIYEVPSGILRGYHSHKELEQVLICMHGSCKIIVDDGYERETFILDDPSKGLYIGPGIWREMADFQNGAVLTVLASQHYEEDDYIRDYNEFLSGVKNK